MVPFLGYPRKRSGVGDTDADVIMSIDFERKIESQKPQQCLLQQDKRFGKCIHNRV